MMYKLITADGAEGTVYQQETQRWANSEFHSDLEQNICDGRNNHEIYEITLTADQLAQAFPSSA